MWRLQIVLATLLIALLPGAFGQTPAAPTHIATAAAPPCNNYFSNVTPPENIGVGITDPNNRSLVVDVVYRDFKSYAKDVLPNEWLSGWKIAAYEAGALAVKNFAWYWVNNWRSANISPVTGECYHVTDWTFDQRYIAGSSTLPTAFAVEQTWNWVLHSGGAIYASYHRSGFSSDACGQWAGSPADGRVMSQYGSRACAVLGYTWAQTVNTYYFSNWEFPGEHTYGQWHAALTWGPAPWWPLSISGSTWKFRNANNCGAPSTIIGYGNPADIKIVGDWDGNGSHTPVWSASVAASSFGTCATQRRPGLRTSLLLPSVPTAISL